MFPALLQTANRFKFLLTDNSTTILTAVGVVGTVGTAVLTGRASFKAAEIISEEESTFVKEDIYSPDKFLSKTEKCKLVWKEYLPPAALGVTTVACIIVAHKISSKKIAALAIAGGVSERALQEYKDKVVEKLGERQSEKIRDEIAQDHVNANPPGNNPVVVVGGEGDVLCYDDLTGRYFYSTVEKIKAAENKVNFTIIQDDSCSLSYFFDEIGLKPTTYSDMVGWNINTKGVEVKFSATMTDTDRPCLVLGYSHVPETDYDKLWAIDR